jgi:cell division septation protein DedD
LAAHPQDDGFHEIQLNGKQLVFLFMAATVVSVVIFLCGVLVGRGVQAGRGSEAGTAEFGAPSEPAPQPAASSATPVPTGSDPTTAAAAPPAVDDLSYFNRLQASNPSPEKLNAPGPSAAAPQARPPAPAARAVTPSPEQEPARAAGRETAGSREAGVADARGTGYAVQIAALNIRSEADAIARRMAAKGYAAYVVNPASGTPQIYRVRIGTFGSRREAETIATKLEKEEQFKPWVTR